MRLNLKCQLLLHVWKHVQYVLIYKPTEASMICGTLKAVANRIHLAHFQSDTVITQNLNTKICDEYDEMSLPCCISN